MKKQLCSLLMISLFLPALASAQVLARPYPEKLFSYSFDQRGVNFQVYSGGCTDRSNFKLAMTDQGLVRQVVLYRVVYDACLALFPYGTVVHYDYRELDLHRGQMIQILNPLRPAHDRREEP